MLIKALTKPPETLAHGVELLHAGDSLLDSDRVAAVARLMRGTAKSLCRGERNCLSPLNNYTSTLLHVIDCFMKVLDESHNQMAVNNGKVSIDKTKQASMRVIHRERKALSRY